MADRDWPAFWRALPPREAWSALEDAPRMAGPWSGGYRCTPHDRPVAYDRADGSVGVLDDDEGGFRVVPDRASADAALRAADWILVDEEGAT